MKCLFSLFVFFILTNGIAQNTEEEQIKITLNNYIDGFYQGDTTKLKAALKPRLYKFGYLKNQDTGKYNYYEHLSYTNALKLAQRLKDQGKLRDETEMRSVDVLEIANHIAAAKVTATWGIDYVLLSKDDGKWMIEEVLWEGPFMEEYKTAQTTTYYLIRHAEKDRTDKSNSDPHLTTAGLNRAKNWTKILSDVNFDKVYSTNYNRTKETALPTANANNLHVEIYDPRNFDINTFKMKTKGKTVLIVGHSNTTPMIANQLIGEKKYEMIEDNTNGNLYIINISNGIKTSSLIKID
ncbi:histidine phosphatase family protein [Winogradskyella alexanderae]|uniref:Nuclear transport factor 2 family protein n=1 Tax=Winogradskyella alexanderae TaxID=2877123 RepID=A0ABS7XSW4_9FLAO|nr:histidine phosphatase family protein [Winogradskyella alexanderae]MCA0133105.1 nuclear transport factor 2 family protein [Winogradskyella alexanderae]